MKKLSYITSIIRKPSNILILLTRIGFTRYLFSDEKAISIQYRARFNKKIDLKEPLTFNEKLLWLTLHDRKPIYTTMVDKYRAKVFLSSVIGQDYIVKSLGKWKCSRDITFDSLPSRFVLKCNHDSGSVIICKDRKPSKEELEQLDKALKKNYFWFSREWPYKNVQPCIFAEEYIESPKKENGGLIDYKVYCFNGEPKFICLISNRETKPNLTFVDLDWKVLPFTQRYERHKKAPEKPSSFNKMIDLARQLSSNIPFLRVDYFQDLNEHLFVGELTFTPSSALIPFEPEEYDYKIGQLLSLEK